MEDTLRVTTIREHLSKGGLNPCSNGRYSQRDKSITILGQVMVLILVLMEDTLRVSKAAYKTVATFCLNPCSNGRYSQRARHTNPLYKLDWYL